MKAWSVCGSNKSFPRTELNAETFRTPQRGDREGSRQQHTKSLETRMNLGLLANLGKEKQGGWKETPREANSYALDQFKRPFLALTPQL